MTAQEITPHAFPGFPPDGSADNLHTAHPLDAGSGQERAHLPVLIGHPTIVDGVVEGALEPFLQGPEAEANEAGYEWLLGYRENENTARSYARSLEAWFTFCRGFDVDPLEAPRQLVERYKAAMFDWGLKPSTVNQRLSAVSSFYKYCDDEGLLPGRDPTRGVRRPKVPSVSTSTGLTREELNDFLAEAKRRGPMMHALMMLLAMNGLRASEPLPATVEDVGTMRGHATLMIERKGAKGSKVKVPLAPVTATVVEGWMTERASLLGQVGRGTGLLFFGFRYRVGEARQLDRRDVYRFVKAIGAKAVPTNPSIHPHDLRHAFVTLALDAGVPLRDVQDSAGHASADTTRRYDRGRNNIDRHATYTLAAYLAGGTTSA
jgi:integrase/recombinase XerD